MKESRIMQYFVIALGLALLAVSAVLYVTVTALARNHAAITALQAQGVKREATISALERQVRLLGAEPVTESHSKAPQSPQSPPSPAVVPSPQPTAIRPAPAHTAPPRPRATKKPKPSPKPTPTCHVAVQGVCVAANAPI